jgi:hypothetical protein
VALDVARLRHLALSDSGFVFDPLTGFTYSVNAAGLFVLSELKKGLSPDAVAERLAEAFEVGTDDDVIRDVEDFVARLRDDGLVQ